MKLKILFSILLMALSVGCQTTDSTAKFNANADQYAPAISVSRPQLSNDFPVSYWVHPVEIGQRTQTANRIEIVEVEKKPEGWFEKLKNLFEF